MAHLSASIGTGVCHRRRGDAPVESDRLAGYLLRPLSPLGYRPAPLDSTESPFPDPGPSAAHGAARDSCSPPS